MLINNDFTMKNILIAGGRCPNFITANHSQIAEGDLQLPLELKSLISASILIRKWGFSNNFEFSRDCFLEVLTDSPNIEMDVSISRSEQSGLHDFLRKILAFFEKHRKRVFRPSGRGKPQRY
ncbi:MAG: hypothetical protein U5K69_18650 [Balneolaceae bacterium]|nr:hypothetical protein [Balneolaceae bacterium]